MGMGKLKGRAKEGWGGRVVERIFHYYFICLFLSFTIILFVFSFLSLLLHFKLWTITLLYQKAVDITRESKEENLTRLQDKKQETKGDWVQNP